MSHFDPERYSRRQSPIHLWEPRTRIISLSVLIISLAMAGSIRQAAAGLIISFCLVLISRLPFSHVSRFMKWPAIFLLPLAVIVPFTAGGDKVALPAVSFLSIAPSAQGILLGILLLTRGLAAALVALVIVSTAPFTVTIRALEDLGLPGSLTQLFLFSYRYVFLLNDELQTMSRSMICKGFAKKSDLNTLRVLAIALTMLFIRSYERALGVFYSMLSRGYSGELPVSGRCKIKRRDFIKSLLVLGAALGICFL